jgi:hypothetical protein
MKLEPNETELIGKWIVEKGKIRRDETCERVEKLVAEYLREIARDSSGWEMLYQDPEDRRYWEFTYPQSHMHGGGPPALKCLSREEAKAKYKISI